MCTTEEAIGRHLLQVFECHITLNIQLLSKLGEKGIPSYSGVVMVECLWNAQLLFCSSFHVSLPIFNSNVIIDLILA